MNNNAKDPQSFKNYGDLHNDARIHFAWFDDKGDDSTWQEQQPSYDLPDGPPSQCATPPRQAGRPRA
ncbi:MAG: hypothetical protein ACREX9_05150 [Gammaproteobacteria bacterium]